MIYTAVCGTYPIKRTDIQCFTGDGIFTNPVMEAKRYKILPHLFIGNDVTIWIDANIWAIPEPLILIDKYLGDADMAVRVHPRRQTVWQEFSTLLEDKGRFAIPWLQQQLLLQEAKYRLDGLPNDAPLYECNFIIRRNNARVNRLMEAWWAEICRWQWRDQVSLPYVLWKYGGFVRLKAIREQDIRKHPSFRYVKHY